jgi:hypothetical protein
MAGSHVTPTTQVAILEGGQFSVLVISAMHTTTCSMHSTEESKEILLDMKALDFDVKKVAKFVDDLDCQSMNYNFSLDSRKLRRYIVEDVMIASPDIP